jgi:flagellar motility protein MotE (MotC chaperone)
MKSPLFGINIKVSNLLAAVAVLSLCKLILLAVLSVFQPLDHSKTLMVESVLAKPSPAYAQTPEPEVRVAPQNLSEEWQVLRQRQEEVQRREQTLQALEQELDAKLIRLQELEKRIQAMLEEADVLRDEKIKHLVDVYSNMKPRQAASALAALEEPVAVKILSGMRGRNAGEILSFVDAEKAARLTEALTRMQLAF